jgi:hypothetical protein
MALENFPHVHFVQLGPGAMMNGTDGDVGCDQQLNTF